MSLCIRSFKGWAGLVRSELKSRSCRLGSCFHALVGQQWCSSQTPGSCTHTARLAPPLHCCGCFCFQLQARDFFGGLPWGSRSHFAQMARFLEKPRSLCPPHGGLGQTAWRCRNMTGSASILASDKDTLRHNSHLGAAPTRDRNLA